MGRPPIKAKLLVEALERGFNKHLAEHTEWFGTSTDIAGVLMAEGMDPSHYGARWKAMDALRDRGFLVVQIKPNWLVQRKAV